MKEERLRVGEVIYASYADQIHAIRDRVFVEEQQVPIAIEHDDRDPHCLHVLAWLGTQPVATGRLDAGKGGKIGRVAVLADQRGQKLGEAVMQALHDAARRAGLSEVKLHAQQQASAFYERLGYQLQGDPFMEAEIVHVTMVKRLV